MTDLSKRLIQAFTSFRTKPEEVESALEAFVDERIALARKARKPRERRDTLEIDGFAEWYAAFPRREARKAAARAYIGARRQADTETLLAGAKRYAAQCSHTERNFIKIPATWLNAGCWADEYPAAVTGGRIESTEVWFNRLDLFYNGAEGCPPGMGWSKDWGPPPGDPACRVSAEALQQFEARRSRRGNT